MLNTEVLKDLARSYLAAYVAKDLKAIEQMLTQEVSLQDWNIAGHGADFFLAETQKNFEDAKSIKIEILQLLTEGNTVAARLMITVDDSIQLDVVDVITFDENGKMAAIRAFKG